MSATISIPAGKRATPPDIQHEGANRVGTIMLIAAVAATLFALLAYLFLALNWRGSTFFGALLSRAMVVDGSIPVERGAWTALEAGMRRGDRLLTIDGESLARADDDLNARAVFRTILDTRTPGEVIEVTFERASRDGAIPIHGRETCGIVTENRAVCQVRFPLSSFPDADFAAFFIIPFVCGLIAAGISTLILALRPRSSTGRAIAASGFTLTLFMIGLFDINTTYQLTSLWILGGVFTGAVLVGVALVFPSPLPIVYRYPYLRFAPYPIALIVALILIDLHTLQPGSTGIAASLWVATLTAVLGCVVILFTMLRRRATAGTPIVRDQTNAVIIGVGLSLIIGVIWLVNLLLLNTQGVNILPLNTSATMPFFLLPILSLAYATLQYRLVDTDRVLSQSITYTLLLIGLIGGYFLLVFSGSLIAQRALGVSDPLLVALIVFGMAVLFVPLRSRLQARIDQIYYRRQINYQARIETFAQQLGSLVTFGAVIEAYQRALLDTLQPSGIYIFLPNRVTNEYAALNALGETRPATDVRFKADSPLIAWFKAHDALIHLEPGVPWLPELLAERANLLILDAVVIVELRGANQANGFVVVGAPRHATPKRSARQYTYEELRFIESLTNQISVAVERAQVIESLERRVRELAVLSQVSQAANFTIAYDDLLELISTQTFRLIDGTHFYIVLYDEERDELSFAFFLEDDTRYGDKEGVRWRIGRDLYSEIVRRRQAVCVPSFAAAMADRNAPIVYEDDAMTAWLGVPLLAGSRVLGAMAIATHEPRPFSDDQIKILQDIAALAATSLDKARLFQQTNVRARQLAALNDISRQLVASESDIDKLLALITASATDILEAEAGSLLLTTEDGSGDLQFEVVIGGGADSLMGVRIPAGRGLVGEVAATGRPIIVSNATTDPRWSGELSKGAFHTSSVLAAPLTAQGRVIGVLEVLNKVSGGGFTNEDTELLSTFAGQAAIAIENARLFRLTDEQLSARLSELETLERIDVELNRSLDLRKVAEITVRYAIANSPATAGAIGLIVGEPAHLELVYLAGYENSNLPSDQIWDVNRGILRRVMRTRQPDLVPNVAIDPDYVPLLARSLSQITIPMLSGRQVVAMLILETDQEPRLRIADMPFLQRLAEHAAIAIANAKLYADLRRVNDARNEFVSFIAHELKNPLTSVKGYVSMVRMAGANDMQQDFLERITRNADRMRTIVDDLNDVTKLETNNMKIDAEPCNFREVVDETLASFEKRIADKEQTIAVDVPDELPLVMGDKDRLIQVMTNLVSNAHKYTPQGGRLGVRAEVIANWRNPRGEMRGTMLRIAVADTGIGMSKDDLGKLFQPYFRTDRSKDMDEGTGLGMTLTKGLIEQHSGEIWVESEVNVGTTFYFTLPLAPAAALVPASIPS
jgi:signal transduction histidine kinase